MLYRSISHGHTHQQDAKLLSFILLSPGLSLCVLLQGLRLVLHRRTNSSWQLLSVLRPVGGKSLCPVKLQRTGDIFYKKKN